MKRIFVLALVTALALPTLLITTVFADETGTPHKEPVPNTTTPVTPTVTDTAAKPADDAKALAERITKHKVAAKTKLATAEKLRIQNKCKAAQGLVSSVSGKVKGLETSRTEVYKNIVSHLTDLSVKLKNKGLNTDALDANIITLQAKIETFKTDLAAYKQLVNDLSAMDCKTDPEGFKIVLDLSRAAMEKANQDGQAVRSYVKDTIKPLLKTIRADLDAKKTEGSH